MPQLLREYPTVIVGGTVKSTDASIGGIALNQIGQLNFDKLLLERMELMIVSIQRKDMEEELLSRMRKRKTNLCLIRLVKKLDQVSLCQVAPLAKAKIITNKISNILLEKLRKNGD